MKIRYRVVFQHIDKFSIDQWESLQSAGWVINWTLLSRYDGRYGEAWRCGLSLAEAIAEFEEITGIDTSDEVECEICDGSPHAFYEQE